MIILPLLNEHERGDKGFRKEYDAEVESKMNGALDSNAKHALGGGDLSEARGMEGVSGWVVGGGGRGGAGMEEGKVRESALQR